MVDVGAALSRIRANPTAWVRLGDNHRRCRTSHFPYGLIYAVREDEILILAVLVAERTQRLLFQPCAPDRQRDVGCEQDHRQQGRRGDDDPGDEEIPQLRGAHGIPDSRPRAPSRPLRESRQAPSPNPRDRDPASSHQNASPVNGTWVRMTLMPRSMLLPLPIEPLHVEFCRSLTLPAGQNSAPTPVVSSPKLQLPAVE